jgi:hypothetical protein
MIHHFVIWQKAKASISHFMRSHIKKGDKVAIAANPNNHIIVKQVNKKSITSENGVLWEYDEIRLVVGDMPMPAAEFLQQYKSWLKEHEA